MQLMVTVLLTFFIALSPVCGMAYIGPGLATGTLGVILGVLGSVSIAVFALLWYPLKKLFKKLKKSSGKDTIR
jgi:preprotein translocase subunit SecF